MDFRAHGRPDLAARFVNRYLEATGDYEGVVGLRFFAVHRALVRAKVALLRATPAGPRGERRGPTRARGRANTSSSPSARARAARPDSSSPAASPARARRRSRAVSSSASRRSACARTSNASGWRGSRRMRARAAPLGEGLYDREAGRRTYARLEQLAESMLASGHSVIVDAAFLTRRERAPFRALARRGGFEFRTVVCEAPVDVLRARIEARRARGRDASEADAAVLDHQLAILEPPSAEERADVVTISTDQALEDGLRRLSGPRDAASRTRLSARGAERAASLRSAGDQRSSRPDCVARRARNSRTCSARPGDSTSSYS